MHSTFLDVKEGIRNRDFPGLTHTISGRTYSMIKAQIATVKSAYTYKNETEYYDRKFYGKDSRTGKQISSYNVQLNQLLSIKRC